MDKQISRLVKLYDDVIKNTLNNAEQSEDRALGGVLRAEKGNLVEILAGEMVKIAWVKVLKEPLIRLTIDKKKTEITMKEGYVDTLEDEVLKNHLIKNKDKYSYKFGTDVQVRIDGNMALAIECKSYTENAMMKRIIFDANLMHEAFRVKKYYLLQLESQLGGDYSSLATPTFGSPATNVLLSRSNVPIVIITLVKGERKVKMPIHNPKYYKPINENQIKKAIDIFSIALKEFV